MTNLIYDCGTAPQENTNLPAIVEQAVALTGHDCSVFPCRLDKRPACPHGFHQATRDPDEARVLWRSYPGPLIGVATGTASGFDVLDLDAKHAEAREWWDTNSPRMPATRRHRTRSDGAHLLFQAVPGLRCSAGRIAPGVDVRANGGYIIWWPAAGFDVLMDAPLAPFPEWLANMARPAPVVRPERTIGQSLSDDGPPSRRYALGALRSGAERVVLASEGTRNSALNAEAFGLMRFVPDALSAIEVADTLAVAALSAGLSNRETVATLASALRAGGAE